jgi:hypothetical protein
MTLVFSPLLIMFVLLILVAKRSTPSGAPGQCHTGPVQCCNKTGTKHSDNYIDNLLGLVEAHDVGDDVLVGVECTPVTAVGVGGGGSSWYFSHKSHRVHDYLIQINSSSHAETVCCKNNNYKGVVVVGCSPGASFRSLPLFFHVTSILL